MTNHSGRSRTRLLAAAAASALCGSPLAAMAAPTATISVSPYGLPSISGGVASISLTGDVGVSRLTVNPGANSVVITSANGGRIVQGSVAGQYAAPVTGGTVANPVLTAAPYLSTETGTITLGFAQAQSYLGLLWGSVGPGDELDLLNGSTTVATVSGPQVMSAASSFNSTDGAQGFGGSEYTLVNLIGGTFTEAVLRQNGQNSFEASTVEYSAANQAAPAPEPASIALISVGILGAGLLHWRARRGA